MSDKTSYDLMEVGYRFSRNDGQPMDKTQRDALDDSMFELISEWAQQHSLTVVGECLFREVKK